MGAKLSDSGADVGAVHSLCAPYQLLHLSALLSLSAKGSWEK